MHALLTRLRLPPLLAALLSSAVFGIAHVGNERTSLHKAIYAAWTFVGGLVFSAAYVGTAGGLALPVLLHFGLNSIVFGHSIGLVAHKIVAQREAVEQIAARLAATRVSAAGDSRARPMSKYALGSRFVRLPTPVGRESEGQDGEELFLAARLEGGGGAP